MWNFYELCLYFVRGLKRTMDIINHYDVITYEEDDIDKYTNESILDDCTIYYMNGKRHRDNDLPAIIYYDGEQEWYINGLLHRDNDKPAIIHSDGAQSWYKNGLRHRDDGKPAIIYSNGQQEWWVNGNYVR